MPGLNLCAVSKSFGAQKAVDRVDLDVAEGALTALLGPSGCGKTTLLRMIAGLETPTSGEIRLGDTDITGWPAHRRRFGMVFQNFALFPHLDVRDNVCYALTIAGVPRPDAVAKADRLLDLVQLSGFGDRRIGELSGGQRQRVAIARALAQEPEIFLLDEPMSALDAKLREEMQVELRLLQQRLGITTIVVTHDQREAMTMADRIVVMSGGRLEQVGPPQDIYHRPANGFVAGFIGKSNFLTGIAMDGGVRVAGTRLTVSPPPRFRAGSTVEIACRPEDVHLAPDGAHEGEVAFVRDLGATSEIHLTSAFGRLIAERPAARARDLPQRGARLRFDLPPEALKVYPAPDPAMAAE